ncbi:MAG: preprotein translocase subunit SecA [Bernardetiaceae bacterium]|nr:preprotein translocase subunit SecA [Bernardetiaceae bacterium]
MLDKITQTVAKIFGTKSDRDRKKLLPYVNAVNTEYDKLRDISDDALRGRTREIKAQINDYLRSIDDKIAEYNQYITDNAQKLSIDEKEQTFEKIDELELERNKELELVLEQVLPAAFAVVKETARRLKENKQLVVEATDFDRQIAARRKGVEITDDGKAIWANKWVVADNELEWDMLHYDVQIIGGVVLHQGKVAEMATGEGKTLVATFPAYLNALAERGVHVITVNDYLAKRDAEWMAPLFEFHGMRLDCIDKYEPNSEERRQAYRADITYGTNNEFGFDYLRDNMARNPEELVQRKHHYAMVDEVDSVLIDEARTPLIISGPVPKGNEHEYKEFKPRIEQLVEQQRKLVQDFLTTAKKELENPNGDKKAGGLALFRAHRGFPDYKPLVKFLSKEGMRLALQKTENIYLADNSRLMPEADEPLLFTVDKKNNNVQLTEKGGDAMTKANEDSGFFILPDIGSEIANIDTDDSLDEKQKNEKKEQLIQDYTVKTSRIHTANQLLKAYALFEKDVDYVLMDDKVKIVDEQTGRVMDGRRYSDGLHQALEAKENVKIEDATQTYATITLQNYFRMYHKLAGMTGTAETEATELWEIYKLDVTVIPTNRPIAREDMQDVIYRTKREKFKAVAEEVERLVEAQRPVLVGTTSVENSEVLSRSLQMRKIEHRVLNAKQHQQEAEIVANAGKPGVVTIATNMAGRGTDIKLPPESKAAGGLAIVGTERHESRRVDRQLRGRAGRQGDPGSSQFFVSLEDDLMRRFGSDRIAKIMDKMGLDEGEMIKHSMVTKSIERAQTKVEENNFGVRKHLLEYDDVMNKQRQLIYKRRKHALFGDRLTLDIMNMFYDLAEQAVGDKQGTYEEFKIVVFSHFGYTTQITEEEFNATQIDDLSEKLYQEAYAKYQAKNKEIAARATPIFNQIHEEKGQTIKEVIVPFTDGKKKIQIIAELEKAVQTGCESMIKRMEQMITLAIIDNLWKEHLRDMDDLRSQVQLARFEQKDPLIIYKFESLKLFEQLIDLISEQVASFLSKSRLEEPNPDELRNAEIERRKAAQAAAKAKAQLQTNREEDVSTQSDNQRANPTQQQEVRKPKPRRADNMPGRNDVVTVRYHNGKTRKDKFKKVEQDLRANKCVLV